MCNGFLYELEYKICDSHIVCYYFVVVVGICMQFYVDTVKQMALHQLIPGSPLRTLCLLIAGQPAEVFSVNSATDGNISNATNVSPMPAQVFFNLFCYSILPS